MNIILALILVVLFFILLILFTPVNYTIKAGYQDQFNYSIKIAYGFLFTFVMQRVDRRNKMQFMICGISMPERNKQLPSQKTKPVRKQSSRLKGIKTLQSFLENRLQASIWRLLKQLLTACQPNEVIITGRYGFYEPHLTAWVLPCLYLLDGLNETYCIDLYPVWDQEYLEMYLKAAGSIIPALLLWYLLVFILQASTWRFLLAVRKNKSSVQPF